ncbi:hypothetical protein PMAYCL1PPCAC_09177 [Pristionchus mayeri]|uniref:Uncharacterized protein n=1 Tax=Pristionchus mayeri TaxID=1317129 RepID=A0AAN4ZJ17_9BILA|nr:hypothetical protein PMAYCL1PPCAC_09177 [Pristionchus mayeri]
MNCSVDAVRGLSREASCQVELSDVEYPLRPLALRNIVLGNDDSDLLHTNSIMVALVIDVQLRVDLRVLLLRAAELEGSIGTRDSLSHKIIRVDLILIIITSLALSCFVSCLSIFEISSADWQSVLRSGTLHKGDRKLLLYARLRRIKLLERTSTGESAFPSPLV